MYQVLHRLEIGPWHAYTHKIMPKTRRASQRLSSKVAKRTGEGVSRQPKQAGSRADSTDTISTSVQSTSTSPGSAIVNQFQTLCRKVISEDEDIFAKYAKEIKKYMRNQFDFFGIKAPQRRRLQKEVIDTNMETLNDRDVLFSVLQQLWKENERDYQAFGVDLCQQFRKEMLGTTDDHFRQAVSQVQACITSKSWWDTVDGLAYQVIGYFVKARPALGVPLMDQWICDDNMWLRRVAILHQLNWKEDTDKARLFSLCLSRAHEEEFFIRKAIGWALRQYSRTNGPAVRDFVDKNKDSLSGLSIREAVKYC